MWTERVEVDPDLADWSTEAGRRFFEPLRPHLGGVRRVAACLSPMAPYAPLECWKSASGKDLAEEFTFSYSSSPSLLSLLEPAQAPHPASASALLVGNPRVGRPAPAVPSDPLTAFLSGCATLPGPTILDQATLRSALAGDQATLQKLPSLPFSEYEVRKIASCFPGSTVLLGSEASESTLETLAIEDSLGRFDVIHFATHALIDPDRPSRFALVLGPSTTTDDPADPGCVPADGLVTAGDMLDHWRIHARLITLSGCQTGSAVFFSRTGEPMGFLQGLLGAGAKGILLSRWKVDDLATALLMGRFYENLAEGTGVGHPPPDLDEALREARLWLRDLRDQAGNRPFAHPVYWAGFVLFGRPS
jgi:CHAT domain-containing protein